MNADEPAFSVPLNHRHIGLTKREWFAGQAMIGILAGPQRENIRFGSDLGKRCLAAADSLIAAITDEEEKTK